MSHTKTTLMRSNWMVRSNTVIKEHLDTQLDDASDNSFSATGGPTHPQHQVSYVKYVYGNGGRDRQT